MKKFLLGCILILLDIGCVDALVIDCPKVVSPGEGFKVSIRDDKNEVRGFKGRYGIERGFVYKNTYIDLPWKSYYSESDGVVLGNVTDDKSLIFNVELETNMNVLVNKSYTYKISDIEISDRDDKVSKREELSCDIKVLSNINTLDDLSVEGVVLSTKFSKDITSYKGNTDKDKVFIKASVSDKESVIEGDIGEKRLNVGSNIFTIKVKSARGEYRDYKINIIRELSKKSNDVTLKSLSLSSGSIDFKRNIFLYNVDVSNEVESIDVIAESNDKKSSVEIINPKNLIVGENIIKINVKAENGDIGSYVVVVNRLKLLSKDASIKELRIKNYDIDFKSNVYDYYLDILDEDKLDIDVILSDMNAKYKIIGNNNLVNNSVIQIKVTAEAGDTLVYKIRVGIEGESNSSSIVNYLKFIPLFVLLILIILIVKLIKKFINKNSNID